MMPSNTFFLPAVSHFSFGECRWFLYRDYDDCLHKVLPGALRKAVVIDGESFLLHLEGRDNGLAVNVLNRSPREGQKIKLRQYLQDWFDMERDIRPFYKLLSVDDALRYMPVRYHGLRLVGIPDLFEALAWSIIGQQINLSFAYKIKRRLVERFGESISYRGDQYFLFPRVEKIADASPAELKAMLLSVRKVDYLIGLAKAFMTSAISKAKLQLLPNHEARRNTLTMIKGVGEWTANYALMKCLRDPCVPYGDAGLIKALLVHNLINDKRDREGMERLFSKFSEWKGYLVFYLWRSLSVSSDELSVFKDPSRC